MRGKIYFAHITVLICVFYRPPGSTVELLFTIKIISEHNYSSGILIIIMEDFNAPGIQWSPMSLNDPPPPIDTALRNFFVSCPNKSGSGINNRDGSYLFILCLSSLVRKRIQVFCH